MCIRDRNREVAQVLLEEEGAVVTAVSNGREAVKPVSYTHLLTELLRDRTGEQPGIPEAMEKVTEVYEMTIEEIKKGM